MAESTSRTIALLTTWLDGWYQSQLWFGAVEAARAKGCRLLCLVGYAPPNGKMSTTPESVFGLAARAQVDGVLLSAGPLSFWDGTSALHAIMKWLQPKPIVSLGFDLQGVDSVYPEGSGIASIVKHLVREHACRNIAFIGGPVANPDAVRRFEDYRKALEDEGIPLREDLVEVGGFYLEGGMAAMQRLLNRGIEFDAVICANDTMALGASQVLKAQGLQIPKDILLTGFDDTPEGKLMQPPLTTVSNPTPRIAYRGLEICLDRILLSSRSLHNDIIANELVARKSCGCLSDKSRQVHWPEAAFISEVDELWHLLLAESASNEFIDWLHTKLVDASDDTLDHCAKLMRAVEDTLERRAPKEKQRMVWVQLLQGHEMLSEVRQGRLSGQIIHQAALVRDLHRIERAMLADPDPGIMMQNLAEGMREWCPEGIRVLMIHEDLSPTWSTDLSKQRFAYRVAIRYGQIKPIAESEDILPEQVIPGEVWTGVPIEQGNMRFGIVLFRNWIRDETFVEHLRIAISTSFVISWRTRSEDVLRETLRRLSLRDEMTNLYNGRGLAELAKLLQRQAIREQKTLGVITIDFDHLQQLNQRYGQEDGNAAIGALAEALRNCFRNSDVLARLGEDDFAAVFILQSENDHVILLDRLRMQLQERSQLLGKPWILQVSIGWSLWDPKAGGALHTEIEKAHVIMKDEKSQKNISY